MRILPVNRYGRPCLGQLIKYQKIASTLWIFRFRSGLLSLLKTSYLYIKNYLLDLLGGSPLLEGSDIKNCKFFYVLDLGVPTSSPKSSFFFRNRALFSKNQALFHRKFNTFFQKSSIFIKKCSTFVQKSKTFFQNRPLLSRKSSSFSKIK